jgi:universal stress protein A
MTARRIARILVPIDFSATSECAVTYAKMVAATFGASLHLLHVMDDVVTSGALATESCGGMPVGFDEACHLDEGTRLCNLLSREEVTRFHATSAVVFGTTSSAIVRYAAEQNIDLIVMGTHGRSGIAQTVIGSVAERVIRHAGCSVLTVRESGAVKLLNPECQRIGVPLLALERSA